MELDLQAANHSQELQLILRDAATKISKFKDALDTKQQQINDQAYIDQLIKKHETEKQKAFQELSSFKKIMSENEERLVSSYENRVSALKKQVDKINDEFNKKISVFETTFDELKRSTEEYKVKTKHKYESELRDQLAKSNLRYEEAMNDALRDRQTMEASFAKEREEIKRTTSAEMERLKADELDMLSARLNSEKEQSLSALRQETEEKMHRMKSELSNKLESALLELRERSVELEAVRAEGVRVEMAYKSRIEELQRLLTEQAGDTDSRMKALLAELSSAKDELLSKGAEIAAQREEIGRQTRLLSQNSIRIANLDKSLTLSLAEIAELQERGRVLQESARRTEAELVNSVAALEREREDLSSQISLLKDKLQKGDQSLEDARGQYSTELARLRSELEGKQSELSAALNSTAAADARAEVLRQMSERELELASERARAEAELKEKFSIELLERQSELTQLQERFQSAQSAWAGERETLINEKTRALSEAEADMRAMATSNEQVLGEMQFLLRNSQEELDAQRQRASEDAVIAAQSLTNLQRDLAEANLKAEALGTGLMQSKTKVDHLESQLREAQSELLNRSSSFDDQLRSIEFRLQSEWSTKLRNLQASHETTLEELRNDHERAVVLAIEGLRKQNAEVVSGLNQQLSELKLKLSESIEAAEVQRRLMEEQLANAKRQSEGFASDVERAAREAKEELIMAHKSEMDELQAAHQSEMSGRMQALRKDFDKQMADLKRGHDNAIKQIFAEHDSHVRRLAVDSQSANEMALLNLRETMIKEKSEELSKLQEQNANAISILRKDHEKEIHGLKRREEEMTKTLSDEKTVRGKLENDLRDLNSKFLDLQKQHEIESQRSIAENQRMQSLLKEEHENKILQLRKTHEEAFSAISVKYQNEADVLKSQISQLLEKNGELEIRWMNRQSRPEDMARIHQLEESLVEREQMLQRAREEMMYYKREMINREENYNTKFNVSPVVGIMNVINPGKGKEKRVPKPQGASSEQSRRASMNSSLPGLGAEIGLGSGDDTNAFNKNKHLR